MVPEPPRLVSVRDTIRDTRNRGVNSGILQFLNVSSALIFALPEVWIGGAAFFCGLVGTGFALGIEAVPSGRMDPKGGQRQGSSATSTGLVGRVNLYRRWQIQREFRPLPLEALYLRF